MKAYVINMERSAKRKKAIEAHLTKIGLPYEIVKAVDGQQFSVLPQQDAIGGHGELSRSELGCVMSHIKAYKLMVERNDDFALILEDDVVIHERNVLDLLEATKNLLHKDSIALLLYSFTKDETLVLRKPKNIQTIRVKGNEYFLCDPPSVQHMGGACAYILSREVALKMIAFQEPTIYCRADTWEVYGENGAFSDFKCMYPMPIDTNYEFGSEINYTRTKLQGIMKKMISWSINYHIPVVSHIFIKRREKYLKQYRKVIIEK